MICKMFSRHKRMVVFAMLLTTGLFGVAQVLLFQEGFSPLQMLYSSDREAHRLLKFITSYHYQCNSTLNSSQTSEWPVCVDQLAGISLDPMVPKLAYSVGPVPDFSLESLLSRNLSVHQLVFLPKLTTVSPNTLRQLNVSLVRTTIVPNDPADFSRNSFDKNTINSIMARLGHRRVDILKLERVEDMAHSYEILYFMAKDGILARFRQLHVVIEIDDVDEGYLYNWYKTLHMLFHLAGFRLYHTSASSPLCLQVTMMESCCYHLSWVNDPGPRAFVLYPPALEGSEESEVQRMEDFLDLPSQSKEDVISVVLSSSVALRLSRHVLMSGSDHCRIVVFQSQKSSTVKEEVPVLHVKCSVVVLTPVSEKQGEFTFSAFTVNDPQTMKTKVLPAEEISKVLPGGNHNNIVYLDLGTDSWTLLSLLLDSGASQNINQLILRAPLYPVPGSKGHKSAHVLRWRYSELKRVAACGLSLSEASAPTSSQRFHREGKVWHLSFVKS